ncbi:MAG: hypothetical protein NT030_04885, partial [Candidatus Saganbacteria bacterium]|nr:hypothetical protein [Candidatus Saganbacteria bacterium]
MNKIMLRPALILLILIFGFGSCPSSALQLFQSLNKEETFLNEYRFGYIDVGTKGTGIVSWTPEIAIGDFSAGADLNLLLGATKPYGAENFVLKKMEYSGGIFSFSYGVLDDITFGQGLLIKKFNSWSRGPLILSNMQTGLTGTFSTDTFGIQGFGAWNDLYGLELSEVLPFEITLGQSVVGDTNGMVIEKLGGGGENKYPSMVGYSVDVRVPAGYGFELYSEAAHLGNYGNGFSMGLLWGFQRILAAATFRIERRIIDHNFVPNYFDSDYEINPVDIDPYSATGKNKNGVLAEIRAQAPGIAFLDIIYEYYEGSDPVFTQEATIKLFNFFISA